MGDGIIKQNYGGYNPQLSGFYTSDFEQESVKERMSRTKLFFESLVETGKPIKVLHQPKKKVVFVPTKPMETAEVAKKIVKEVRKTNCVVSFFNRALALFNNMVNKISRLVREVLFREVKVQKPKPQVAGRTAQSAKAGVKSQSQKRIQHIAPASRQSFLNQTAGVNRQLPILAETEPSLMKTSEKINKRAVSPMPNKNRPLPKPPIPASPSPITERPVPPIPMPPLSRIPQQPLPPIPTTIIPKTPRPTRPLPPIPAHKPFTLTREIPVVVPTKVEASKPLETTSVAQKEEKPLPISTEFAPPPPPPPPMPPMNAAVNKLKVETKEKEKAAQPNQALPFGGDKDLNDLLNSSIIMHRNDLGEDNDEDEEDEYDLDFWEDTPPTTIKSIEKPIDEDDFVLLDDTPQTTAKSIEKPIEVIKAIDPKKLLIPAERKNLLADIAAFNKTKLTKLKKQETVVKNKEPELTSMLANLIAKKYRAEDPIEEVLVGEDDFA